MLQSKLPHRDDFDAEYYRRWTDEIKEPPDFRRKQWEFVVIAQALFERGMLAPGKRGLGFGVGTEPLPALFAAQGCSILATDQDARGASDKVWEKTNQICLNIESLNPSGICPADAFKERVRFRHVDMNFIPNDLEGFDFLWSSCALEHLGSLQHGLWFVLRAMAALKPGGLAVHTTELNLTSDEETLASGPTSLFRRRDIESLRQTLAAAGFSLEPLDLRRGSRLLDLCAEPPALYTLPRPRPAHLSLVVESHQITSLLLIIRRFER